MATLKSYIDRIEALEDEKKGISEDIASVYKEAKGEGYDATVMKAVVKRRKLSDAERIAADALLETYEANLEEQFELPMEQRRGNLRQAEEALGSLKGAVADKLEKAGFEHEGGNRWKSPEAKTPETVN